ncbi:uncharacterized protein LOC131302806 [Rhododendron vialii]|uniref:uncharacterized protein LOC131302806 n=1 Tax=Rhododendron vialii TaxID=182163 RepID=UPI00265DC430|nr:uncharacterized protein LOC131302806 [Rhododendron vialii]
MGTDSWREIVAMVPKDILICSHPHHSTWLDGVFYWVAANPHGRYIIVAFHMFNELFEHVFFPEDIKIDSLPCLCVLRDSLALFTLDRYKLETEWCLGIWVRDGNRVKDPWNKKYSFGPNLGCYLAFGLMRNGGLLLRGNHCWMVSYNLDTRI